MKRIIGISTMAHDLIGARTLYIEPGSFERLNAGARRATRTKTLDGGVVVYDAGFSVADQTFEIRVRASSRYTANWFAWLVKSQNLIRISTDSGVFTAVPARWSEINGIALIEALVMSQLA
jgi:hypothetical protein